MNGRLPSARRRRPRAAPRPSSRRSTRAASGRPAAGVLCSTFCRYCERKKIEPNIPKYMLSEATLVTAKERLAKKRHRQHRLRGCDAPRRRRRHEQRQPGRSRPASTVVLVQPSDCARTRPNTMPKAPARASSSPRRSSVPYGPWLSRSQRTASGQQHEADGDVDPEDPVPGDALHDRAADERADRHRDAADARPHADRHPAPLRREGLGQQGERQRRHHRRARPLDRARGHQQAGARGERRRGGRRGEHADADQEHALAPEAVAERGAGQAAARRRRARTR